MNALFRLTQGIYFLALGIWAGTLVAIAVAAPTVFDFLRAQLDGGTGAREAAQAVAAADVLAGGLVGRVVSALEPIQWACATAILLTLLLQCGPFRGRLAGGVGAAANVTRVALVTAAVGAATAHAAWAEPAMWRLRETMYSASAPQAKRAEAERRFAWYHTASERLLGGSLLLVVAAGVASPFAFREAGSGGHGEENG